MGSDIGPAINIEPECKFDDLMVLTLTISDINNTISNLRKSHINKLNTCPKKCYKKMVKCPGCNDTRLIGNVCNGCSHLLSNSSFEDMPCLKCS